MRLFQKSKEPFPLLELPTEIILKILNQVSAEDLKYKIKVLSPYFYKLVHEVFEDSFYGQALRFNNLQFKEINNFKKDLKKFRQAHTVTTFNRPHEDSFTTMSYHFSLTLIIITLLLLIYINSGTFTHYFLITPELNQKIEAKKDSILRFEQRLQTDSNVEYLTRAITIQEVQLLRLGLELDLIQTDFVSWCMIWLIFSPLAIIICNSILNHTSNQDYQNSFLSSDQWKECQVLLDKYKVVTGGCEMTIAKLSAASNLIELFKLLNEMTNKIELSASTLKNYLLSQPKMRNKDFNEGDIAKLPDPVQQYARYSMWKGGLWEKAKNSTSEKYKELTIVNRLNI